MRFSPTAVTLNALRVPEGQISSEAELGCEVMAVLIIVGQASLPFAIPSPSISVSLASFTPSPSVSVPLSFTPSPSGSTSEPFGIPSPSISGSVSLGIPSPSISSSNVLLIPSPSVSVPLSLTPSPSTSTSASSGIPSPSVSLSTTITTSAVDVPERFVAVTVYVVVAASVDAVPEISPVDVLNVIPAGKEGLMLHEATTPPIFAGVTVVTEAPSTYA